MAAVLRTKRGWAIPRGSLALAWVVVATACTARPFPIGEGRTIEMECAGLGAPTVVLEAGWAADHSAWTRVQPALARLTRVCSYDRAGTGRSPGGPLPRTPEVVANDLLLALDAAGVRGPLVIVGHSIGAIYAQTTARLAPDRVIGLILVDPTVDAMAPAGLAPHIASARACLAAVREGAPSPPEGLSGPCTVRATESAEVTWTHRVSELESLFPEKRKAPADRARSDLHVLVLSAGRDSDTPGGQWRIQEHQALARRHANGGHRIVPSSGHMMMFDSPDVIVDAVSGLVATTRESTRPLPSTRSPGEQAFQGWPSSDHKGKGPSG